MQTFQPDARAIFSLFPLNTKSVAVLNHSDNMNFISYGNSGSGSFGEPCLSIGHIRSNSKDSSTLATLGRDGDIVVQGSKIARTQCLFKIDLETGVVMFYDRSLNHTSQVFGQNAIPFERERPRRVVVQHNVNTEIGMGGAESNLFMFKLVWHRTSPAEIVKDWGSGSLDENPRFAQTVYEPETAPSSRIETRLHMTQPLKPSTRYIQEDFLGEGESGTVFEAINADTGQLMIVKKMAQPKSGQTRCRMRRELEIHGKISHNRIVEFISTQGFDGPGEVEMFMPRKEGNLKTLVLSNAPKPSDFSIANILLEHMLQAIDYLAVERIVHRDLKPENILYVSRPGVIAEAPDYTFQLGDFGQSIQQNYPAPFAGTPIYMAPEVYHEGGQATSKSDVWSLYVTTLWTSNHGFWEGLENMEVNKAYEMLALEAPKWPFQEMGSRAPAVRASAAQMLVKLFNGNGLTTSANKVPPLGQQ